MASENQDRRIKNLGLVNDNTFSVENYRRNLQKIKRNEEIEKSRILNAEHLPKFPEISENQLKTIAHKLMEELDDLDIKFIGVSIDVDFNKPLFILHMPKEFRGGDLAAYDLPEEFMKYKVIPITHKKILFS